MDARILVPGESDVANLACGARLDQRCIRTFGIEDPVRILEANHFVVLNEIDPIGLQSPQRFVELPRRLSLRAPVDLRHQEHLVTVSVAQRLPRADLALPLVVVPRVVHEVDAAIDGGAHDAKRELLVYGRQSEMPAADADWRYSFSRLSEKAIT